MKPFFLFSSLAAVCLWGAAYGERAMIAAPTLNFMGTTKGTAHQPPTPNPQPRSEIAQETWQAFSRPEGGFTVQMPPGTLREGVQPMETELGAIEIHVLGIDLPTRLYAVVYQDFPAALQGSSPDDLLGSTLQGVMGNISRRLQDDRSIVLGGYPGVDLYYEGLDGLAYKQRVYIVNQRLYMLVAATSEVTSSGFVEEADRFFNSFEFSSTSGSP
jgi:hypothetical protein